MSCIRHTDCEVNSVSGTTAVVWNPNTNMNYGKVSEIPCDDDGVMGVPITFLDKYNPSQFEIVENEYTLNIEKGVDM